MKKVIFVFLLACFAQLGFAQRDSVSVTTDKDAKQGFYMLYQKGEYTMFKIFGEGLRFNPEDKKAQVVFVSKDGNYESIKNETPQVIFMPEASTYRIRLISEKSDNTVMCEIYTFSRNKKLRWKVRTSKCE